MADEFTQHLNLPLPAAGNMLSDDVLRLRDALSAIDSKFATLDLLLASDDLSLDTLQEVVSAIKAARTEIGAVNALVASQLATQNTAINAQLAAQNAQVSQQLAALSALVYAGL